MGQLDAMMDVQLCNDGPVIVKLTTTLLRAHRQGGAHFGIESLVFVSFVGQLDQSLH